MTEIKIIFRFNISEIVFPPIEQLLVSDKEINIVSGNKIRNDFLKSESEIALKINSFINDGKIIPKEYWCPFWTALIKEQRINIFTAFFGELDQFIEFEKCIEIKKYNLSEVIYLKVNDLTELSELAKKKHSKIYDRTDIIKKRVQDYQKIKEEIIEYAKTKYKITEMDFFETEILV
ncbi:hypothetical protein GCM10027275_20680 [Rhabdobacter roseus]|uniref:Adenylate kinase family enzyme n=1 Tax=Rhabdobacter roseus TaxID=1655419 RepID=A0A840TWH9_9BACT|nr:nucleoside monophosphate kinase [Rhabdobacter roseus]MBB5283999.1 adenylate kinase family enzyme [Rhabdobacter roseus]